MVKLLQINTEFPVLRSLVKKLRRFAIILRNCVTVWLQLLEALFTGSVPLPVETYKFHILTYSYMLTDWYEFLWFIGKNQSAQASPGQYW